MTPCFIIRNIFFISATDSQQGDEETHESADYFRDNSSSGPRLRRVGYEVDQIPDLMNLAPPDKVSYARYL